MQEFVDELLRKVRIVDEDGEETERPFTEQENADLERRDAAADEAATELAMTDQVREQIQALRNAVGLDDIAGTESLRGIIATGNPVINASPAIYIKALARLVRELTRATIRLARLATRDLNNPAE